MADRQPHDIDLATEPRQPDKSLGELFAEMTEDLGHLTRQEVQLAKVELAEEGRRAARAGGMFAGAAGTGLVGLTILSMAASWLLDNWMPRALAFLVVAVVLFVIAGVLAARGRSEAKSIDPVPRQTVETLKEDAEWAKAQRS
jgi:uncharacterized membrane protein YqjE